jgi:AraC-like DNA-binding protein/mannose-6-phosphate isomerase-like protein (cupin superfamily)
MNPSTDDHRNELKELKNHGTPLLPFANYDNYRRFSHFSKFSMYIHWHDEMEFFWLTEGRALFRLNEEQILLKANDCLVVPAGAIHSAESIQGDPFCFEALVFHPSMLQSAIADQCTLEYVNSMITGSCSYSNPVSVHGTSDYLSIIKELIWLNENQPRGYEIGIKGLLFQAVFYLYRDSLVKDTSLSTRLQSTIDRMKPVIAYINKNYNKKITEDRLAEIANLSKFHFIRCFKKMTGRTPIDYINYIRILMAQRLLEQSDDKILSIALEVGFDDLSYFYRVFEKHNGQPPGVYREKSNIIQTSSNLHQADGFSPMQQ